MKKKPIELLDELYHDGKLKDLVQSGLISSNLLVWRNAYHAFEHRLTATGSVMQSMEEVAVNFNLSVETIRLIRRKLS